MPQLITAGECVPATVIRVWALTVALAGLLAATWSGGLAAQTEPGGEMPPSGGALQPGDHIRLKIWREPELSDTVQVDNAGIATFAKIGQVKVVGLAPDSLERLLVASYSRFLVNPSIDVTFLRRISISGAVGRPGLYPVDETMTIAEAVALAGGASPEGKLDEVELRRDGRRLKIPLNGQTSVANTPIQSGDQLYVPQRSWISRNVGVFVGFLGVAVTTAAILVGN